MMEDISDIAKEVITALNNFEDSFVEKIDEKLIILLRDLSKKSKKEVILDMTKTLNEQNISEESKDFISAMYYYFVVDEENKKNLVECWKSNE